MLALLLRPTIGSACARLRLFLATLGIAGAVASCGGSASTAPVIEVQGHTISQADFSHWLSVTAIRDYELQPQRPVPHWVLPSPPPHTACVAHLRGGPHGLSATEARAQCERQYRELRQQVLYDLTSAEWIISEGEDLGIKVTAAEVKKRSEQVKRNLFPSNAAFQIYLRYTGETARDQLFRSEIKLYEAKQEARELAELQSGRIRQQDLARRTEAFLHKWTARTNCEPGYVIANCKQYRGHAIARMTLL